MRATIRGLNRRLHVCIYLFIFLCSYYFYIVPVGPIYICRLNKHYSDSDHLAISYLFQVCPPTYDIVHLRTPSSTLIRA